MRSLEARRLGILAAFTLVLLAGSLPTVGALIALSRADDTASHIALVPLVTLAFLYRVRQEVTSAARVDWLAGTPIVLGGVALMAAGRPGTPDALSVSAAGLALSLIGGFVLIYGRRAAWAALFPLLFLLLIVPMPDGMLAAATRFLKVGSAETVARLFAIANVPFNRDGFVFTLPGVVIEIADECSGIRSSIALTLTGLIAAQLMLSTTWKKAVLMALIVPIAILKNGIRIVGLSLLAIYVDPRFLEGRLHHEGGIVFFLLGLALLGPVIVMLQRSETAGPGRASMTASL